MANQDIIYIGDNTYVFGVDATGLPTADDTQSVSETSSSDKYDNRNAAGHITCRVISNPGGTITITGNIKTGTTIPARGATITYKGKAYHVEDDATVNQSNTAYTSITVTGTYLPKAVAPGG